MSNRFEWEERPGGLLISVQRFDKSNSLHLDTIVPAMHGTFSAISQKHGAEFAEQGMRNNLFALLTDRNTADIYYAKWKDAAQEICMGIAYGWDTYGITPGGVLVDAEYTEDIALLRAATRQLIRAKPQGKEFPTDSLAKCFERANLQQMRDRGTIYRFGEVDSDNTTMMRQLYDNGALIGICSESALLEFKRLPNNLLDTLPMGAKAEPIFRNGIRDENNFLVTCAEYDTAFRSVVRLGQATAMGRTRADVRAYQQGMPLDEKITKCFINSSLFAMKIEAEDRGYGDNGIEQVPDQLRPLLKSRPDIAEALYPSHGRIISTEPNKTICSPLPEAHIAVEQNEQLVIGLKAAGAKIRCHGQKPMRPGTNILLPMASCGMR